MSDSDTVKAILDILARHDMRVDDHHAGAGKFRDLYCGTGATIAVLQAAAREIKAAIPHADVKFCHCDVPGHADFGKPFLEISSVWWE